MKMRIVVPSPAIINDTVKPTDTSGGIGVGLPSGANTSQRTQEVQAKPSPFLSGTSACSSASSCVPPRLPITTEPGVITSQIRGQEENAYDWLCDRMLPLVTPFAKANVSLEAGKSNFTWREKLSVAKTVLLIKEDPSARLGFFQRLTYNLRVLSFLRLAGKRATESDVKDAQKELSESCTEALVSSWLDSVNGALIDSGRPSIRLGANLQPVEIGEGIQILFEQTIGQAGMDLDTNDAIMREFADVIFADRTKIVVSDMGVVIQKSPEGEITATRTRRS